MHMNVIDTGKTILPTIPASAGITAIHQGEIMQHPFPPPPLDFFTFA